MESRLAAILAADERPLRLLAGGVAAMERRLAAILAADVQGYSRLTELNEEASTVTLRMYRAVVEESDLRPSRSRLQQRRGRRRRRVSQHR